ncbi:aldo/keto reductase [Streptomyces sp. NPDC004838]
MPETRALLGSRLDLANGRLADRHATGPETAALREVAQSAGLPCDAVALAAVAAQPWVDVVLSGAATVEQITSNLRAAHLSLSPDRLERLTALPEPAETYWAHRARLVWA